jgi:hypothetical protein
VARESGSARVEVAGTDRATGAAAHVDQLHDLGPVAGASGALNSLAMLAGEDYLDPYFTTGVELFHRLGAPGGPSLDLAMSWERHESAHVAVGSPASYRPVRPVDEAWIHALDAALVLPDLAAGADVRVDARAGRLGARSFLTADVRVAWSRQEAFHTVDLLLEGRAGLASGDAPAQALYLLGGRATLPGHGYRDQVGDRFWLLSGELGREVYAPWLGVHVFAATGRAWMADSRPLPAEWPGRGDGPIRASAGAGVDLLWQVLRLDVARGLGAGGDWTLILEASPRFHPWL